MVCDQNKAEEFSTCSLNIDEWLLLEFSPEKRVSCNTLDATTNENYPTEWLSQDSQHQELLQQICSFGPNWDYFQTKLHFYLLVSIYPVFLFLPKMTSCLAGIFRWKQQWTGLWHFLGLTKNPLEVLTQSRESSVSNFARSLDATIQLSCFLRQTSKQDNNKTKIIRAWRLHPFFPCFGSL